MEALSDAAVARLRDAAGRPDLSATKYELREVVGRGAMGEVWRAFDRELRREVALKVVSLPEADGADGERLWREARILAGLEHPGLVPVHDVGLLPDGRAYYAMKLVRGRRLDEHLSGEPSLSARLAVFERTCEAVAFAHAHGVLHRDLKPENVMVGPFGEVLVMDWGVAKVRTEEGTEQTGTGTELSGTPRTTSGTEAGTVIGTPGYMAPEQARGEVASERSDVHALGAILHDLLGGRPKTDGSRGELPRGVPPALRAICRKALAPQSGVRYASAGDLVADVRHFVAGEPVVAWPEGPWRRLRRLARRYRTPLLLVCAYLVMRVALAFWAWR